VQAAAKKGFRATILPQAATAEFLLQASADHTLRLAVPGRLAAGTTRSKLIHRCQGQFYIRT
jgi:hypothetical protein